MADCADVVNIEIEIELPWPIGPSLICDENQTK